MKTGHNKKNCKYLQCVLGAAIKCKPYSEITVESQTHLKNVKITLNIFAVCFEYQGLKCLSKTQGNS